MGDRFGQQLGNYRVVVSFQSRPLIGEVGAVRDVRVIPPLPIGR